MLEWFSPRLQALQQMVGRAWFRWIIAVWAVIGFYDTFGDQIAPRWMAEKLPRIYEVVLMTTGFLPWWAWTILGLAIVAIAALEYAVRKERSLAPQFNAPRTGRTRPNRDLVLALRDTLRPLREKMRCYSRNPREAGTAYAAYEEQRQKFFGSPHLENELSALDEAYSLLMALELGVPNKDDAAQIHNQFGQAIQNLEKATSWAIEEPQDRITIKQRVSRRDEGELFPDLTVCELFFALDKTVLNESNWLAVGQIVRDYLSIGQLDVWGRPYMKYDTDDLEEWSERPSPAKIDAEYWQFAQLTYMFLSDDYQFVPHTAVSVTSNLLVYTDLQVNRAQALSLDWSGIEKVKQTLAYQARRRAQE